MNEIWATFSHTKTFVLGSVCPVSEKINLCANKDGKMWFYKSNGHAPRKFLHYIKTDESGMQYF